MKPSGVVIDKETGEPPAAIGLEVWNEDDDKWKMALVLLLLPPVSLNWIKSLTDRSRR